MAIFIESVAFSTEGNSLGTGTTDHLIGCILQKLTVLIRVRCQTRITITSDEEMIFEDAFFSGTGFLTDASATNRFADFNVGDQFIVSGTSPDNDGTYTIIEKLSDNTIRISGSFTNPGTQDSGTITLSFRPLGVTHDFQFLENDLAASYASPIDGSLQRYSYGENAAFPTSLTAMIAQGSKTWQFNNTGARVREVSWSNDEKTSVFEVEHTFYINPLYLINQFFGITATSPQPPSYFDFLNCLKYAFRIRLYRDIFNPNIFQEYADDTTLGDTGWFDERLNGNAPNYTKGTLSYSAQPQANTNEVTVTATINCAGDVLVDDGEVRTGVVLNFFVLPEIDAQYGSNGQTATYNYIFDRAFTTLGVSAVNGENFGGLVQVIKDFTAVKTNTTTVTLSFKIALASEAAARLADRSQKYFVISAYLCDITEIFQYTDVVSVLLDVNEFLDAPINPIDDTDFVLRAINNIISDTGNIAQVGQYNAENVYTFLPNLGVNLSRIDVEILAKETNTNDEVILQSWQTSLVGNPTIGGVPFVNLEQPSIVPNSKIEFKAIGGGQLQIKYPFQVRYEEWQQLFLSAFPSFGLDGSEPFNGLNQNWARWGGLTGVDFIARTRLVLSNGLEIVDEANFDIIPINGQSDYFDADFSIREISDNSNIAFIPTDRDCVVQFTCETDITASKYVVFYAYSKETGEYYQLSRAHLSALNKPNTGFLKAPVALGYSNPVVTATCRIDYTKLPSVDEITIFAQIGRLNTFGNVGVFSDDFDVITLPSVDPIKPEIESNPLIRCCYIQTVFGDTSNEDALRNDRTLFLKFFPKTKQSAPIILQKAENGAWVNKFTLAAGGAPGTMYPLGFVIKNNLKYIGYDFNWRWALNLYGSGIYRLTFDGIPTECYNLKHYNSISVNGSVRFDYVLNSVIGDKNSAVRRDFSGLNLPGQIRISKAIFGSAQMAHTIEKERYENGKEIDHINELKEAYQLEIRAIPYDVLKEYSVTVFQADSIIVTDYNSQNASPVTSQDVVLAGGIEPNYQNNQGLISVLINFEDRYNNRRKNFY